MNGPAPLILQSMSWPTSGMMSVPKLFLRTQGDVALIAVNDDAFGATEIRLGPESTVGFDTWFNAFNLGTWASRCGLSSLTLTVQGVGNCRVTVQNLRPDGQTLTINEDAKLAVGTPFVLDMAPFLDGIRDLADPDQAGVLVCSVVADDGPATLTELTWGTFDTPRREPDLTIVVTTFRREAELTKAADRFAAFRRQSWLKDHLSMMVIDNGQTLSEASMPEGVTLLPNANLGGAGGFTRGLLEARQAGTTHVLFMDDDASIQMNSLERTWTFLAYAQRDDTALGGAMATETVPWAVWENGATFFGRCRSLHGGTDLTDRDAMLDMEFTVAGAPEAHLYGGWWYFAFPVHAAEHLAFPFFVRGDDVSFSLANSFDIVRLNGVISFQDSFVQKESPQTWYLDLRSHLAHHLSLPHMDAGRWFSAKIVVLFLMKNLVRMHYDTLSAVKLALSDVLDGPQTFVEHIDMSRRRADLAALTQAEHWVPADEHATRPKLMKYPMPFALRLLGKLTLNGHLIPGFGTIGKSRMIKGDQRGNLGFYWGAARMMVMSADRTRVYTVEHSKSRAAREAAGILTKLVMLLVRYSALRSSYQSAYPEMTSEAFWRDQLGMAEASCDNAAASSYSSSKGMS